MQHHSYGVVATDSIGVSPALDHLPQRGKVGPLHDPVVTAPVAYALSPLSTDTRMPVAACHRKHDQCILAPTNRVLDAIREIQCPTAVLNVAAHAGSIAPLRGSGGYRKQSVSEAELPLQFVPSVQLASIDIVVRFA